jgi:hypothetical protein
MGTTVGSHILAIRLASMRLTFGGAIGVPAGRPNRARAPLSQAHMVWMGRRERGAADEAGGWRRQHTARDNERSEEYRRRPSGWRADA